MGPFAAGSFLARDMSSTGALAAVVIVAKRASNCSALSLAIFLRGVKIRYHLAYIGHNQFGGCFGDCNNTASLW